MEKNVCTLWCPQGTVLKPFKTTNIEYTCSYKAGKFEPEQIPQCMIGMYYTICRIIIIIFCDG